MRVVLPAALCLALMLPTPAMRRIARNRAAETLRRTGRVTVNPQAMFAPAGGGETGVGHRFDLRLD